MVPVHKEQWGRGSNQTEILPLVDVALRHQRRVDAVGGNLIHAEVVPDAEVEIGLIGGGGQQCAPIQGGIEHRVDPFRMRIPLDGECECAARQPLRVEGMLHIRQEF